MHCKSYSHFFSKKFQHICVSLDVNFNESLTNDVVSFEQLGPGHLQWQKKMATNNGDVQEQNDLFQNPLKTCIYCHFDKADFAQFYGENLPKVTENHCQMGMSIKDWQEE